MSSDDEILSRAEFLDALAREYREPLRKKNPDKHARTTYCDWTWALGVVDTLQS